MLLRADTLRGNRGGDRKRVEGPLDGARRRRRIGRHHVRNQLRLWDYRHQRDPRGDSEPVPIPGLRPAGDSGLHEERPATIPELANRSHGCADASIRTAAFKHHGQRRSVPYTEDSARHRRHVSNVRRRLHRDFQLHDHRDHRAEPETVKEDTRLLDNRQPWPHNLLRGDEHAPQLLCGYHTAAVP